MGNNMSTGFITTQGPKNNDYTDENFDLSGLNTGNLVFIYAIKKIINCDYVDYSNVGRIEYDNYVTPYFIWIRENEDKGHFSRYIEKINNKNVVLMSVGLQSRDYNPDFKMHDNTVRVLMELSERCTLGVRGDYTASILDKYGIKNIQVIGCPSLYSTLDPNFKLEPMPLKGDNKRIICNYKTLLNNLSEIDMKNLGYLYGVSDSFIDQTKVMIAEEKYNTIPNKVKNLIEKKRKVFFTIDDWSKHIKKYDFSIGARFHGNVMAILNKVPSLVLTCDSRTKEMVEFFGIPNIEIGEFDTSKPIEYYYEKADYSLFNKKYKRLFESFCSFAKNNGLKLNI